MSDPPRELLNCAILGRFELALQLLQLWVVRCMFTFCLDFSYAPCREFEMTLGLVGAWK